MQIKVPVLAPLTGRLTGAVYLTSDPLFLHLQNLEKVSFPTLGCEDERVSICVVCLVKSHIKHAIDTATHVQGRAQMSPPHTPGMTDLSLSFICPTRP